MSDSTSCSCCAPTRAETSRKASTHQPYAGLERCCLDAAGLAAQAERYRRAGRGAVAIERTSSSLVVRLNRSVDPALVEQLLAVERACCPFFDLEWDPRERRLAISVAHVEHETALAAVASALDLQAPPS